MNVRSFTASGVPSSLCTVSRCVQDSSLLSECRGGEGEGLTVDGLPLFVILSANKTSYLLSTESAFCALKFKIDPLSP